MELREELLNRLSVDILGPSNAVESIQERPTDRYLTGVLWPKRTAFSGAEDESLNLNDETPEIDGDAEESVALRNVMKPASAGLSFAVRRFDEPAAIAIRATFALYEKTTDQVGATVWIRKPVDVTLTPEVRTSGHEYFRDKNGLPKGVAVHVLCRRWDETITVTATLLNERSTKKGATPDDIAAESLFQTRLEIKSLEGCELIARPSTESTAGDDDGASAALIYRDAREFATGHMCSASWELNNYGGVDAVFTSWLPSVIVPATSADGDSIFGRLKEDSLDVLSAEWLSAAKDQDLIKGLALLPQLYLEWLGTEAQKIDRLPTDLRDRAKEHVSDCQIAAKRMSDAVNYLSRDRAALGAFRFANEVMRLQRSWSVVDPLRWRPFQLGFVLLALESVGSRQHPDRKVMDLLWFPTGGGKTEAYLFLTVFAMTIRRLTTGAEGNGIAVLMRYTLRLLTIQQFQRASAMVLASELLRRRGDAQSRFGLKLGATPFSIGLWVGGSTTPNKRDDVLPNPSVGQPDHRQLKECPCCGGPLSWRTKEGSLCAVSYCLKPGCSVGEALRPLPVWTVDEDIYREQPSLLIATADKFAQIVRNEDTASLFGSRPGSTQFVPPDLIIQDELHLISGPLGSMAGLYECAIDEICARKGWRAKVIGSTATIRRAADQVKQLFWRSAFQFPPPVLDRVNSCFAVQDPGVPGRLYIGVTTAGRSAKFTLQAVCASLMQATQGLNGDRDPYTTLIVYFNSLRELGGALVMMHDDVPRSIEAYSVRKNEQPREINRVGELTSRVSATEIPDILKDLMLSQDKDGHYDVTLASNMISVGVDVPRLGLMVVNGQPKNFSEYIQATSRVGRGKVAGLVIGIYNASRNRDRSHYETFRTWHSTLYRAVEATSVTPFAPRAQDKALHAVVVALARHLGPNLLKSPQLTQTAVTELNHLAQRIVARVKDIDESEAGDVERRMTDFIDDWFQRSSVLKWYWNDRAYKRSLLISAEVVAALRAARKNQPRAVGTPNSLRDVEPASQYILLSRKPNGGRNAS